MPTPVLFVSPRDKFRIDADGVISFFGGHANLTKRVAAEGMLAPNWSHMKGWRARSIIPPHWLATLIRLNALEGGKFDLNEYIVDPISWAITSTTPPPATVEAAQEDEDAQRPLPASPSPPAPVPVSDPPEAPTEQVVVSADPDVAEHILPSPSHSGPSSTFTPGRTMRRRGKPV